MDMLPAVYDFRLIDRARKVMPKLVELLNTTISILRASNSKLNYQSESFGYIARVELSKQQLQQLVYRGLSEAEDAEQTNRSDNTTTATNNPDSTDSGTTSNPEDVLSGELNTDSDESGESDAENVKVEVDTGTISDLRIIYQTLRVLGKTFRVLFIVSNNDDLQELYVTYQTVYQQFRDFVNNFEAYDEDERKKAIGMFKRIVFKLAKVMLKYIEEEL